MKEFWNNNTWANWLKDRNVPENVYCLVQVVGFPKHGKKVLAISKQQTGDDLIALAKTSKVRCFIMSYCSHNDGNYSVTTMYLSE